MARRQYQKVLLEKSIEALENIPFDLRDHSSMTIAIDKKRLPELKDFLKEIGSLIVKNFQEDGEFDEVYQFTMSLFPATTIKTSEV